jgi:hypothetical protein
LVGAVGIELKATLKMRKLLILLNEKNAKNTGLVHKTKRRAKGRKHQIQILQSAARTEKCL